MWIERDIASELRELARTFPVVALVGPRQVGKTSILERTFPEYRYASLDLASLAESAETRPQDFLNRFPPPVVLDEIQYAPSFFRHIKTAVDERKGKNGLFIMTGSQNFMLMDNLSESLAGRTAVVPFLGLSGLEWAQIQNDSQSCDWQEFLFRGYFPALWAGQKDSPSRERWYQGYLSTYIERDVRNLLNVGSLRDFERFLRACAARCGQMLNLSELGRDVGVSSPTAKQWLSVLQSSNLVFLLEPYYRSKGKRIAKSPKLYFTDTGLAAFLLGFDSAESLWASKEAGALWETHVLNQWLRWRDWHEPSLGLWYWRDQAGNEVDFLLEKNRKLIPIECKLTERPGKADLKGIKRLKTFYGQEDVASAYLACPIDLPYTLELGITAVPGWQVWPLEV